MSFDAILQAGAQYCSNILTVSGSMLVTLELRSSDKDDIFCFNEESLRSNHKKYKNAKFKEGALNAT